MTKCDHTIGIFYEYADTRLITESDHQDVIHGKVTFSAFKIEEVDQFNYCPFCGCKLEEKTCS